MSSQNPPQKIPVSGEQSHVQRGPKPSRGRGGGRGGSSKLRGRDTEDPNVRMSKTLSWILRHGAKAEGLAMREDGYVKVTDLLANPRIRSQSLDFPQLENIVAMDKKKRYHLVSEDGVWWIKATQGHSIEAVKLDLKPILSLADVQSGIAVHGTSRRAWASIATQGLSKMGRNHIHIAQGIPGDDNVISGMRNSSQVFIFIDIEKAIATGIKFYYSDNGVILTEGNEAGILSTEFFLRVESLEQRKRVPMPGWEGIQESK